MAILILNIGSKTIKWAVFEGKWREEKTTYNLNIKKALEEIKSKYSIDIIAHRVVHGGKLNKNVLISDKIPGYLKSLEQFAPLHQKNEVRGIEISRKLFPKAKQVAVLDTEFHATIPEKAKIYAIPFKFYKKGIRRYGFHGISHRYVSEKVKVKKLVSCHLGAGCSICAIKSGKSIDISMGFTPLEGTVMVTRSGSIDPGILIYLKNENLDKLLNEKSGTFGISGINDFKKMIKSRDKRAKLALEVFCYSVAKQIGAYAPVLGGVDAIAFTGGIGENSSLVRKKILQYIKFLKPKVFIIKTNEKEIMLREALKL
jgi:acetate kinase